MKDFLEVLVGTQLSVGAFFGYFLMALFGALFIMAYRANKKKEEAHGTPESFSIFFMLRDNALKIIVNLFAIGFAIRFSSEAFGQEITGWLALIIGISSQLIVQLFANFENGARKISNQ